VIGAALLGLAAGDVLGAGFEGEDRAVVRAMHGPVVAEPLRGALYTDDTQQALVLAFHILRHGRVRPQQLAADLAALAGPPSAYRGVGRGFAAFLGHLHEGAAPDEAAQPSAGNGAAMRVAPIGIANCADFEGVLAESIAAGLVTHADPIGVAAGTAVAVAIWAASLGQRGSDLVHSAADAAAIAEHRLFAEHYERLGPGDHWHAMSRALQGAVELAGEDADDIAAAVGSAAAPTSALGGSEGTEPYAPASVVTAVAVAAGAGDGPMAVGTLVGLGGDTDTMAAIAGAIWGGTGFTAWPWPVPNRDLLLDVGERLAARRFDVAGLPDLYAMEIGLGSGG